MGKAKKQHWVPKFYLREFATEDSIHSKNPQVWMFPRHEGDPKLVNVKDIASKRYLYSPQDDDGNRCWQTEDKLARLESTISQIWPALSSDFIDLNYEPIRKGLSLFVATLILRHPNNIEEYKVFQDKLIKFFNDAPKDNFGRPNLESVEIKGVKYKLDNSDWEQYANPTDYTYRKLFVDQIDSEAVGIAKILMKKRWSIVFSEKPYFITSDNPVTMFNQDKNVYGLATEGTVVNFPISPTRVLIMDDRFNQPVSQYYPLSDIGAGPANILTWTEAHKFMITGRHPDEVCQEMITFEST